MVLLEKTVQEQVLSATSAPERVMIQRNVTGVQLNKLLNKTLIRRWKLKGRAYGKL